MGVRLLLDTHVLVWLTNADGPVVPPQAREAVTTAEVVLVSSISMYELATTHRLGKIDGVGPLLDGWGLALRRIGATSLDVSTEHARRAGRSTWEHRDPFDRLLVAQAQHERLTLLTADATVLAAPEVSTLAW